MPSRRRKRIPPPSTPEDYRQFLRDLMLSGPAREMLAQALATDSKVLTAAMKLAAGEMDAPQESRSTHLTVVQAIMEMPEEAQTRFIERRVADAPVPAAPCRLRRACRQA